jgi:hypothetical protein
MGKKDANQQKNAGTDQKKLQFAHFRLASSPCNISVRDIYGAYFAPLAL